MKNSNSYSSINTIKIFITILIAVVVLIFSALAYYNYEEKVIKNQKYGELKAIAQLKKDQLIKWRTERLSEAAFFPSQQLLVESTKKLIENRDYKPAKDYLYATFKNLKINHSYQNIFISSLDNEILYSLDSGFNTLDNSELKEIKEVFDSKEIIIKDFYYCKTHNQIHLDFIAPIINENQKSIAVLIFKINPNDYLFPLIEEWPLPSETGESFLFRVEGNEVVYLNPLKENKNQTLSLKNTLDEKDLISVKGALGLKGIVEGTDYSGQRVLADLNSIDGTPWFIVSKINQSEVYSELRYRATAIAFVVFLSLLVFTSGILLLYKYRQSNLYKKLFLQEKEFSDAKDEFKTALYSIGDAVITTDINGFINHMNFVAENLTGYKESEAQGMKLEKVFKIISEDTHLDVDNPVQKILKEGNVVELANHTLLVSKDGTEIPIADSGSPIKNTANEIIGVVLVFRDQSEERKAEQRLKENEAQFRLISNLTSDYLFSTRRNKDGEQETVWVAGAFEKITGYTVEEYKAIGGWRATLMEEDIEKDLEDFKKLEQNEDVISEIRNYKKDGSIVWVRSYGHPIWDEKENRLDGIIGAVQDITESKLAEIALKKSEENYRLLVENQSDLVVKVDREGRFQFVSPSYCKLFNKTEAELIGQSFYPLVHEDDVEPTRTAMLALYKEPYTCFIEQRALTVNGWTWIAWSDTAVLDAEGNIDYIIGVGRDINKSKLAEGRLKSSEEKFHKAFDISPDAININRVSDGLYVSINNGFKKVTGYSEEEVIGKTSEQIKIWYDINDRNRLVEGLTQNGYYENLEARFRMKNGDIFYGLMSASLIDFEGVPHILSVTRDITTRKLAEINIKKLSIGMEQSPAITLITDVDGKIEYANPKFTEVTGYTFDEIKGKTMRILSASGDLSDEYEDLWETLLDKRDWRGEYLSKKKNGDMYWESVLISPIVNEKDEITNFIGIMQDITERKNLTSELLKAKEKAEEMNKIKSYFFANMSHELRTPFVGIMGFAEVLSESVPDQEHKNMAEAILNSAKRLTDTLNKILNVTKLEFDKLNLIYNKFDVCKVVDRVIVLFSKAAEIKNIKLKSTLTNKSLFITSDEKVIEDALCQLVSNSIKFTNEGTVSILVETKVHSNQQILILKIIDTGIGIPEEMQETIFLEFRQASEGLNRSFEGTGLGLTITKKSINMLGGTISLNSEFGKGSEFTIELPVTIEEAEFDLETNKTIPVIVNKKENAENKFKLLYVEDDMIALQYVKQVLSKVYEIDTAQNAQLAINLVNENTYDAFLLDINLGHGMDGVELAQIIKQNPKNQGIPMVAVTAYASDDDKADFLSKGFTHYISKPFVSSELLGLLKKVLQS